MKEFDTQQSTLSNFESISKLDLISNRLSYYFDEAKNRQYADWAKYKKIQVKPVVKLPSKRDLTPNRAEPISPSYSFEPEIVVKEIKPPRPKTREHFAAQ